MLATGIGASYRLAIGEIVGGVDAVNEDHTGLGIFIGRLHDLVPQHARRDGTIDHISEDQRPLGVSLHRRHEIIGDEDRQVEVAQP